MGNKEIRVGNLRILIKEFKTIVGVSDKTGISPAYLSQILNATKTGKNQAPRAMGEVTARKLEKACGKPEGWMDLPHDTMIGEDVTVRAMMDIYHTLNERSKIALLQQSIILKKLEES